MFCLHFCMQPRACVRSMVGGWMRAQWVVCARWVCVCASIGFVCARWVGFVCPTWRHVTQESLIGFYEQTTNYKLCLLTYKTLTNQQPTYLYNSLSFPSHSVSTRSSDSLVLSIPYVRSSLGKRPFSVIGPRLWNSLPPDTRNSNSLPTFRSRLKTHLFKIAFPP